MAQRASDPAGGMLAAPRFQPGAHALLEVGNDLVGDPAVDVLDLGHVLFPLGMRIAIANLCPSARPWVCKRKGASRGPGCTETSAAKAEEAGRKPLAAPLSLAQPGQAASAASMRIPTMPPGYSNPHPRIVLI